MQDPALKAEIAENGRKRFLSEFTAAKMALKYHDLLCAA
jgi:hypothetical protein